MSNTNITMWFIKTLLTLKEDVGAFEKCRASQRACKWNLEHRVRANRNCLAHHRRKLIKNPAYRMEKNLRTRIWWAMRATKCKSENVKALLGCSVEEFKQHIEKQFQLDWTWDNWGVLWEIDHIRPCASFDLTDLNQRRKCFHFSNQRPLSVFDNRSKGSKTGENLIGLTHG